MQISNNKLHRIIIWPTMAAGFIILILLSFFLYFDVYNVIIQADEVVNLKMNVSEENIDTKKFNSVIEKIENKIIQTSTTTIKNLFK